MTTELPEFVRHLVSEPAETILDHKEVIRHLRELARQADGVDFVAVGLVARRAWASLRMDTEETLARFRPPVQEEPPAPEKPWDFFFASDWYRDGNTDARFTDEVLHGRGIELNAVVRRPPAPRLVTVEDLADALRDAYAEARDIVERSRALEERRGARQSARARPALIVHDDDPAGDVRRLLARLPEERAVSLRDAAGSSSASDRVSALQAALQLAKQGVVQITQPDFPYGPVWIQRRKAAHA